MLLKSDPRSLHRLSSPIPAVRKQVAQLATLLIANSCARRADRVALLMLVAAELPGFIRGNPPSSTSSATTLTLAPSAHHFFLTGEPEIADRYFPWLVNLLSPAVSLVSERRVAMSPMGMRMLCGSPDSSLLIS
jgi:hypothetical protein